jgi:hypothetical protein
LPALCGPPEITRRPPSARGRWPAAATRRTCDDHRRPSGESAASSQGQPHRAQGSRPAQRALTDREAQLCRRNARIAAPLSHRMFRTAAAWPGAYRNFSFHCSPRAAKRLQRSGSLSTALLLQRDKAAVAVSRPCTRGQPITLPLVTASLTAGPLVEHPAPERFEFNLPVRVALPRAHDNDAFSRRDPHVREAQRGSLRQPQPGEQQHRDDRAVSRRGLLRSLKTQPHRARG